LAAVDQGAVVRAELVGDEGRDRSERRAGLRLVAEKQARMARRGRILAVLVRRHAQAVRTQEREAHRLELIGDGHGRLDEFRGPARLLRPVAREVVDGRRLERWRRNREALRGGDHEQVTPREVDLDRAELVRDRETRLLRERRLEQLVADQVLDVVDDSPAVLVGRGTQPVREAKGQRLRSEPILRRNGSRRQRRGLDLVALEVVTGDRRRGGGGRRSGGRRRRGAGGRRRGAGGRRRGGAGGRRRGGAGGRRRGAG